jgi:arylsulfatase A-like enzyme
VKILATVITAFVLIQSTVRAEEPRRSISRSETSPARPNVLFITADDLGLQLGCYGDTVIETPHLDALAASGVQFDVAYVAQASCSPSRSAMFTGLYPHANGQYGLTARGYFALHPHLHDATIPNIFKRAGYRTGIMGKLHVAPGDSFQFDYRGGSHIDVLDVKLVAERASKFMAQSGDQPFFLMVNYTDPHAYRPGGTKSNTIGDWSFRDRVKGIPETLVEPSEKTVLPFQQIDSPEQRKRVAGYYNSVKRLDIGVGLLLETLNRHGHADNTLVIFIGDHGPPFNRGKATVYEGGLRIPFLVRWPGVSKPMRSSAMVSTVDILPTILDATGATSDVEMHGRSLRPVLENADAPWREFLVGEFHVHGPPWFPQRATRDGRYKLIHNLLAGELKPAAYIDGDIGYSTSREDRYAGTPVRAAFDIYADPPEFELYDLENDPWEFHNLAGDPDYAETEQRLKTALEAWRKETDDPALDPAFHDQVREQVASPKRPGGAARGSRMQSTARADKPWRFLTLADWHIAEVYVQPHEYPEMTEEVLASLKMLKANYGGDLVILPGDSNKGHWDTDQFIKSFKPGLTPAQAILQAGELCYSGMVDAFKEAGYSKLLMAVGDHELGDNPWPPGTGVSKCQPQFREAFASVFNVKPDGGRFIYDKPVGKAASRPLGTKYESTSYAHQHKNVLFVTVDVFHQEDPGKNIGKQGSVTGAVTGRHLAWLDHVLSEARKDSSIKHIDSSIKHIFVQAHLPVLQPVRRVNSSGMLMDDEMESDFWKTLRKHKVDIYFAGEVHSNTVTKDPKSDLVQVVTRAKFLNNFVTVDISDDEIDITLYNQVAPKPSDGKYDVYGKFVIDKSSGKKVFKDEGELAFLDRDAPMLHFDFEENFALADRQVLGLQKGPGNPFVTEVTIQGVRCNRSFANRGEFGQNYDAQYGDIDFTDGPHGLAGVFNPNSQMAVYGAGPHRYGDIISYALWMKTTSEEDMVLINTGRAGLRGLMNLNLKYALWMKTTSEEDMVLINTGRAGLRGLMNLNLNDGEPELLMADDARLIAKGQKLNDGQWRHIAVSMPKKDCKLSELQFYVDGQPVESNVVGQDKPINISMANKVTIGGLGHGNGKTPFSKLIHGKLGIKPFVGSLDQISVWARALTATEVAELAKKL